MAEESEEVKRSKRRLLTKEDTVRERALKVRQSNEVEKRGNFRAFVRGFFSPLRWLGHQIGKLQRFRVFRWIGLVLVPPYIRNSWRELRQVTWPNRRQSLQLTNAVIIFSVIFGLIAAIVDYGLNTLFKELIVK